MSKVTSKLQVTIPKRLAEQYEIEPGDEIEWKPAGDAIRVELARAPSPLELKDRLKLFDGMVRWLKQHEATAGRPLTPGDRGWTREDLYEDRGLPRRH